MYMGYLYTKEFIGITYGNLPAECQREPLPSTTILALISQSVPVDDLSSVFKHTKCISKQIIIVPEDSLSKSPY